MKRVHLLFLFVFTSICSTANSQNIEKKLDIAEIKKRYPYTDTYRPIISQAGYCMLDKPQSIDTCHLKLSYTLEALVDTLGETRTLDVCNVEIGNRFLKYYGWVCWRYNMNSTLNRLNRAQEQIAVDASYRPIVDYAIFRDLKNATLSCRHLLPFINNVIYEFNEPLPSFEWVVTSDTLTINGYLCYKATGHYARREWTVWFTPQIPIDGGLWKFNGLPGVILKADDKQKHFSFLIRSIERSQTQIIQYDIPTKHFSREKYREIEKTIYRHPFSGSSDEFYMVPNSHTKQMEFLPDDWEIPYNPIERE